jgi:hypothetical protein
MKRTEAELQNLTRELLQLRKLSYEISTYLKFAPSDARAYSAHYVDATELSLL